MDCVIAIRADGSQDDLIRIKDVPASEIDFTRWKAAEDTTMKAEEILYMMHIDDLNQQGQSSYLLGKKKDLIEIISAPHVEL
ncbi:hypothetical protein E4U19_007578 [Claviceps sp. Clav32 group G5]|nr:hypothetical protein E4U19_007578 [Claviceps sp. Clav32 group G5]KAG6041688.1 hypothetical protein E4U39_006408 [Claviceps sp. Clav50 group G5]